MENKNKPKIRTAYMAATCAAAASKAAVFMHINKRKMHTVTVTAQDGREIYLNTEDIKIQRDFASCAVKKTSIDNPDLTQDILIYSMAEFTNDAPGTIKIEGGIGIGKAAAEGMDAPVGEPVIQQEPREIIENAIREVLAESPCTQGIRVTISIPSGKKLASIYKELYADYRELYANYTDGFPLLSKNLIPQSIDSHTVKSNIHNEMLQRVNKGIRYMVLAPGRHGVDYAINQLNIRESSIVSADNFMGDAIDYAVELNLKGLLIVGHIGKMVKMGAGIMNTHSHNSDGRLEILCASAIKAGVSVTVLSDLVSCFSIDDAIDLLKKDRTLEKTMLILSDKIMHFLDKRCDNHLQIEFVAFSNKHGELCRSERVNSLMKKIGEEPEFKKD